MKNLSYRLSAIFDQRILRIAHVFCVLKTQVEGGTLPPTTPMRVIKLYRLIRNLMADNTIYIVWLWWPTKYVRNIIKYIYELIAATLIIQDKKTLYPFALAVFRGLEIQFFNILSLSRRIIWCIKIIWTLTNKLYTLYHIFLCSSQLVYGCELMCFCCHVLLTFLGFTQQGTQKLTQKQSNDKSTCAVFV